MVYCKQWRGGRGSQDPSTALEITSTEEDEYKRFIVSAGPKDGDTADHTTQRLRGRWPLE